MEWSVGRQRDAAPVLGDVVHSLLIACTDEAHQAELLTELLDRGLDVRPVLL